MSFVESLNHCRRWCRDHPLETGLLAAGIALRLAWLDLKSLWWDEAITIVVSQGRADLLDRLRGLDLQPPLHFLIMHFWMPLFEDPRLAIRLFSFLAGAAALAAFYRLGRALAPARAAAALALGAFSSFWIHCAQDGRPYSLFLLLVLLQSLAAWRLIQGEGRGSRPWAAYGAVTAAGLYTHYFFVFPSLAHFLYGWLSADFRRVSWRRWLAVHALAAACYWPWLASLWEQSQRMTASTALLKDTLSLKIAGQVFGAFLFDAGYLGLILPGATAALGLAVIAPLAVWLAAALRAGGKSRPDRAAARYLAFYLASGLAAVFLAEKILGRALVQPRYLLFLSPHFYLLLALAGAEAPRLGRRALVALAAVVLGTGIAAYYFSNHYLDSRLSVLSAFLRGGLGPRNCVVHLDPAEYAPLRYYYLPERAHFVAWPDRRRWGWLEALPGYPGALSPARLAGLPSCVVFDPQRRFFSKRVGLATGAQLALLLKPAGRD